MDALIHTGDLAQVPVEQTYQRYLAFVQSLNVPYYQIPGNHDDSRVFPFHQHANQVHAIHFGTWTMILLNSAVQGKIDGWVEQARTRSIGPIIALNLSISMSLSLAIIILLR